MATTGPELYRTADWTPIWPATVETSRSQNNSPLGDVQFLPGEHRELLISFCGTQAFSVDPHDLLRCVYAVYSAESGQVLRQLPDLTAYKAAVSPEGHWVVSGATLEHLPTGTLRTLTLDGQSPSLSIFTPNGDIIANMPDNTLVRYCRSLTGPGGGRRLRQRTSMALELTSAACGPVRLRRGGRPARAPRDGWDHLPAPPGRRAART